MYATIFFITAISVIFFILFWTFQRKLQYWKRKNVPHLPTISIFGNFAEYILNKKPIGILTEELCQKFSSAPYFGAYYGIEPAIIVQDPEFIKLVLAKDFQFFNGRELSDYNEKELLLKNLFFANSDTWKGVRQKLTPLFTTAKMRKMFHLIEKCSHVLENVLDREVNISKTIEVRRLMASFTMDCIGSCTLGVDTNTQEQKDNNPFRVIGDAIFDGGSFTSFKHIARSVWPGIFYALGYKLIPTEVQIFFDHIMKTTSQSRNYKPSGRNDFVDMVLKVLENKDTSENNLNSKKDQEGKQESIIIPEHVILSQCFGIFAAGYETSAITLAFVMYELAKNFKAQEKVLEEVDAYLSRHDNVLKYECVSEMPYLIAAIEEVLRLYPVLATVTREVIEDYTMPDGLKLEKLGLRIHIPIYHLHHNPDYFPEPEKYLPERFYGDVKLNIKPFTYLPFGEGPRMCIGIKFARMQMVVALITLLKKYRLELAADMKTEIEIQPKSLITSPKGGINLEFVERDGWEQRLLRSSS